MYVRVCAGAHMWEGAYVNQRTLMGVSPQVLPTF